MVGESKVQPIYFVAFFTTTLTSMDEVRQQAPEALAAHIARSRELHAEGTLVMAGAFLDNPGGPVSTMGVLTSREAAEAYAMGDPFVQNGMVSEWHIRPWANILG
ncbi:MAG: hypothetical protein NVS9B1_24760 [Candidatus Dormibacteraceae bacterium]